MNDERRRKFQQLNDVTERLKRNLRPVRIPDRHSTDILEEMFEVAFPELKKKQMESHIMDAVKYQEFYDIDEIDGSRIKVPHHMMKDETLHQIHIQQEQGRRVLVGLSLGPTQPITWKRGEFLLNHVVASFETGIPVKNSRNFSFADQIIYKNRLYQLEKISHDRSPIDPIFGTIRLFYVVKARVK